MSKPSLILGFGHKRRSGKDTAYKAIADAYSSIIYVRRFAFADAVKELAKDHSGTITSDPNAYRELLQAIGSKGRLTDEFTWIDEVAKKIAATSPQVAVITDLRYKNEVGWLRSQGGVYVRLDRIGFPRNEAVDNHVSEHDLDNVEPDQAISASTSEELTAKVLDYFTVKAHNLCRWAVERGSVGCS